MNKRHKKKNAAKLKAKAAQPAMPTPKPWGDSWLPTEGWMRALSFKVEYLSELHDIITGHTAATHEKLSKKLEQLPLLNLPPDEEYETADVIVDDAYTLRSIERWSTLLQLVALFHQLEHELGVLFKWILSGFPKTQRSLKLWSVHRWKELRALFKETCASELTKVASYNDVNELRLLCNCVKHAGGKVTRELADFTQNGAKFRLDDELTEKNVELGKYRKAVQEFLVDFTRQAEDGLQKRFGTPPKRS